MALRNLSPEFFSGEPLQGVVSIPGYELAILGSGPQEPILPYRIVGDEKIREDLDPETYAALSAGVGKYGGYYGHKPVEALIDKYGIVQNDLLYLPVGANQQISQYGESISVDPIKPWTAFSLVVGGFMAPAFAAIGEGISSLFSGITSIAEPVVETVAPTFAAESVVAEYTIESTFAGQTYTGLSSAAEFAGTEIVTEIPIMDDFDFFGGLDTTLDYELAADYGASVTENNIWWDTTDAQNMVVPDAEGYWSEEFFTPADSSYPTSSEVVRTNVLPPVPPTNFLEKALGAGASVAAKLFGASSPQAMQRAVSVNPYFGGNSFPGYGSAVRPGIYPNASAPNNPLANFLPQKIRDAVFGTNSTPSYYEEGEAGTDWTMIMIYGILAALAIYLIAGTSKR